jgi:uncharacterized Ntn-hydrolase superfamily protein
MKLATYSIVAMDPKTGWLAVGGGTNWFGYGRWVPWGFPGYGVVATQAETNINYAFLAEKFLKDRLSADEVLEKCLKNDPDTEGVYQLMIIDENGNAAAYTGKKNHFFAGHIVEKNFGVAGNTLVSKETLEVVASYFKTSKLSFPHRIIKALQEGQKAGGDIRGMKSASIKIVKDKDSGKFWDDTVYDLRVDNSKDPLGDLEKLYYVAEAYKFIDQAESTDDLDEALINYEKALEMDPNNPEVLFWMARIYDEKGESKKVSILREKLRKYPGKWDEYWKRQKK